MNLPEAAPSSPLVPGLAAAAVHSAIFHPGMVVWDARVQMVQSISGHFTDEHPPLMAALLRLWFSMGFQVGGIFLLQEALFWTALAFFLNGLLVWILPETVDRQGRALCTAGALLLFFLPLTPFNFYAATVVKDTWFTIALFGGLHFFLSMGRTPRPASVGSKVRLGLMALCFAAAASLRHNAVVILPLAGCLGWVFLRTQRNAWIGLLLPFVLYGALQGALEAAFPIEKMHSLRLVLANDLIGFEAKYGTPDSPSPFMAPYLRPEFRDHFGFGHIGAPWTEDHVVDARLFDVGNYPRLKTEYIAVLRAHPLQLADVKLQEFLSLLGLDWSWSVIPGSFDLNPTLDAAEAAGKMEGFAGTWIRAFEAIGFRKIYRPIMLSHAPWMALDLIFMGIAATLGFRRNQQRPLYLVWFLLFCFPLSYDLSYLLASTNADYRFMMPATLMTQCMLLCFLFRAAFAWKQHCPGVARARTMLP